MDDLSARRRSLSWCSLLLLVFALALPRAARIAYPRAWAEDEQFFAAAELIRRGDEPYRDFVHVNLPVLEQLLAIAFEGGGTSLLTAELFSAIAALLGTLAIARFSVSGAILLATSALLFRYHVFEREVFYASAAALAFACAPDAPVRTWRGISVVGALLGFGILVKFSAVAALAAYLVWMLLHRRPWWQLGVLAAWAFVPAALLVLFYRGRHGSAVELQLFAFLLAKGTNAPDLATKFALLKGHLEPVVIFAAASLIGGAKWRIGRGATCFALLWLIFELVVNVVLKRTIWPHNLLPALFPLSIFAGRGVEGMMRACRERVGIERRAAVGVIVAVLGCFYYTFFGLRWSAPGSDPEQRDHASTLVHGFGGLLRSDLHDAVAAIDVQRGDRMVSSSDWIPALSGADPLFRFWESHGVWRELERAAREGRLQEYLGQVRSRPFDQRLAETLPEYLPALEEAWSTKRLRFFVSTSGTPLSELLAVPLPNEPIRCGQLVIEVLP